MWASGNRFVRKEAACQSPNLSSLCEVVFIHKAQVRRAADEAHVILTGSDSSDF